METIRHLWAKIYDQSTEADDVLLEDFLGRLSEVKLTELAKSAIANDRPKWEQSPGWYKEAVVYSLYVDLFNQHFAGLIEKLDYLQALGINCLWLLPILLSPMKDAGFDISDYNRIRPELLGDATAGDTEFDYFLKEAHRRGMAVIFDIAMNHCSEEHSWFKEARVHPGSPKRDYFIWNDQPTGYDEARVIFKGMCESNWAFDEQSKQYYFHRFFDCQPDLNYRNPEVLIAMTDVLITWRRRGVDGFRMDAVPYLWKEEGTTCENLPKTHLIVQFFRAVLDYLWPSNLLLAEACQQPQDVVDYFGNGFECHAAYHFPLMPQIFKALAIEDGQPIVTTMSQQVTPAIPEKSQWFTFLRCHDELTLEMVTPADRKLLYDYYTRQPNWDFRQGEGIAARLADLFQEDKKKIMLAYNIIFSLIGTPVIYYGDEFGKVNDQTYYEAMVEQTGHPDARYLTRGVIEWATVEKQLASHQSLAHYIYHQLQEMIAVRQRYTALSKGRLTFIPISKVEGSRQSKMLAYRREYQGQRLLIIMNLSVTEQTGVLDSRINWSRSVLGRVVDRSLDSEGACLTLSGLSYVWLVEDEGFRV